MDKGQFPSRLNCLGQSQNGKIWVGTMGGLVSYDGHTFKTLSEVDGLAENWVTSITEEGDGELWIGHWAGGISKVNAYSNVIEVFPTQESFGFAPISDIMQIDSGQFIVATVGKGLFLWHPGSVPERVFINAQKHVLNINQLLKEGNGNIWICSDEGVYKTSTNQFESQAPWEGVPFSGEKIKAKCIFHTKEGALLAGTNKGPWQLAQNGFVQMPIENLASMEIGSIDETNGEYWFASPSQGTWSYNQVTGELIHFNSSNGLGYNKIRDLLSDREGNMWIATIAGLDQYTGKAFTLYKDPKMLASPLVWDVHLISDGVLCGTSGGVSVVTFGPASTYVSLHYQPFLSKNDVVDVILTQTREVYALNRDGEVAVFSLEGKDIENPLRDEVLFGLCLFESTDGKIWIGTKNGVVVKEPDGRVWRITRDDGLGGNIVNRIFQHSDGSMWFAALGGKLTSYANGRFKSYGQEQGFQSRLVQTFSEGNEGELIIGTYDHGLYFFQKGRFLQMTSKDGLSSNSIYGLSTDSAGFLWVGHNWGMDKVNLKTMEVEFFGKEQGFMGVEVNADAMACDKEGRIIAGTLLGLQVLDPREIKQNLVEPTLFFTNVAAQGKSWDMAGPLYLEPDQNEITFQFSAISMMDPGAVTFSYKLEGLDKDWTITEDKFPVTYTNLPPGEYSFQVQASNGNGAWTSEAQVINFEIAAPYYRTWWFYLAVFLVLVAGVFFMDKVRSVKLIDAKNALEVQLEVRNQKLVELNSELELKEKRFTGQLNVASKVQKALLSENAMAMSHLGDCFILSRSREPVTSDILFVREIASKLYIALFDSQAAGISGTFISMFAHHAMERALCEFQLTSPDHLLAKMNDILYQRLEKMDGQSKITGVKCIVCAIDLETRKHAVAAAGTSIFHVHRNGSVPSQITEYTAGTEVIGKHASIPGLKVQEIAPAPEDLFYIMSDGFIGQFGGASGKKFNKSKLKELLANYSHVPLSQQKEKLSTAFEDWKGEMEQVDDFCIMGWKV